MTLEKKSKISLKQWVTTIRRYEYELPSLYEKLEYLKVRSIGYSSPSFEPKFGGRGVSNNYSIDYWLERIEACENEIERKEKEITRYKEFLKFLEKTEKEVLVNAYYNGLQTRIILNCLNIKKDSYYNLLKKLNKIYIQKTSW